MGKGKPRAVEKGVLGQNLRDSSNESLNVPLGPVYYPSEIEFEDPLDYVYKIRPEAEKYGICKIVPPKNWKPPFALDMNSFKFPTKTQAIHQLQARTAGCDSKTFELEYNRFLERHGGKKLRKKVVFEGDELDLCKLFNAAKRFGGYDKVVKKKKWKEVFRFVRPGKKISECSKHVLCQLYLEHLYDYETYYNQLHQEGGKSCKRGLDGNRSCEDAVGSSSSKRRRTNVKGDKLKVSKVEEEDNDQTCQQCKSGLHGEVMLLCDRCNKGWHIYCLSPPLKQIPPGNWYCLECLNSDEDSFGFAPGRQFSLEEFRHVAERARKKWFRPGPVSRAQMEKKFWEIVEGSTGEVEVMYGSDLDTSIYGSGFPRVNDQRPESVEAVEWDKYCGSPWNLNNLPKLKGSMLRAVHNNITGVMVPWLYVGMLFSSFCWHFEDHCFYSMNYLHWGEPKCWYSIPGSKTSAFEKVMRDTLPDLFDAQPDLLFQLVTMLNPSVLQDNAVPVYTVLQEPGNFVITFPRSYHAGFNFGLNCAEAVNFAPADWLPHGRFGAELYQLYRKPPVLSHEELLCVVAKGDCDSRASPHVKDELHRIYNKERAWRERLWRSGIVKSSPMSRHKCPEYVGTEEDPTCIICQQYLYLSAVVCRCRPSAFVCLEHWDRLCECKSSKLRFLYRHTLGELDDLIRSVDISGSEELPQSNTRQRQISDSNELAPLTKKVNGSHISMLQLAEKWLARVGDTLRDPYSSDAYTTLAKEAEHFLWAGPEMDTVREALKKLIEAKNWANGIRICLTKIDAWLCHHSNDLKKVHMERVIKLLDVDRELCNEPGHLKLKDHAEEALLLIQEINSVLSSGSNISELELLYSRARKLPIHVKEIEKLSQRISSAKVCIERLTRCVSDIRPSAVEIDSLRKLKLQVEELQIQVPETVKLFGLLREAESCQARSCEILKDPMCLKDVDSFLQEFNNFTVVVPEMLLLKKFLTESVAWKSRFSDVLVNIQDRDDQQSVVDELKSILKDGASLQIQVDELPLVEAELKKACCREKALKARSTKMPLDCIQQLMEEAIILQIDTQRLFVDMSGVLVAAIHWEDRAKEMLSHGAQMSDFEEAIREAEEMGVILPSLYSLDDAVSTAKSWLERSEAVLGSGSSVTTALCYLPTLEGLKDLVFQSKFLKISLEERNTVETVWKKCEAWQHDANSILQETNCLFDTRDIDNGICDGLVARIVNLVTKLECITKVGVSLGYNFDEIPKLRNVCSMLQWCKKALSFCPMAPCFEEVQSLMEAGSNFSEQCASGTLWSSVVDGVKWLNKASDVVSARCDMERCKLSDAEEILAKAEMQKISFPVIVDQLVKSIEKHKLWEEQVHHLFCLKPAEQCWTQILQLKEFGLSSAFNCLELDMVLSEVEKVEQWKHRCMDVVVTTLEYGNSLLANITQIKLSLDRSLQIYDKSSWSLNGRSMCISCSTESESNDFLSCSICKECYHLRCQKPTVNVDTNQVEGFICSYCQFVEGGFNHGGHLRFGGKRPELKMLIGLQSDAEDLCVWVEERDALQELVDKALACEAYLTEIVNYALSHKDKDLGLVRQKLTVALKAVELAGVGHQGNCNLDLALARNLWRVNINRLLEGSENPTIQQVRRHLKEGCSLGIALEDYYAVRLTEMRNISLQWADQAKKVSTDSGALGLDKVFKLIEEGKNLPVHLEKELKLLKARSMLHCICRKPYDEKSMVACYECDEWYHLSCVKLCHPPKFYICAACKPEIELPSKPSIAHHGRSTSATSVEPKTPSPPHTKSRTGTIKAEPNHMQKMIGIADHYSGIERLWWRNRKPFRRSVKKRSEFEGLSTFFE